MVLNTALTPRLAIRNECSDPPRGMLWQVRKSLRWIDPRDLKGISLVRLIDELPEVKNHHAGWYKEAVATGQGILGWYNKEEAGTKVCITLHIKQIYFGLPRSYRWTPIPIFLITRTLAHEVAHHVVATRGYILERSEKYRSDIGEEAAANRYVFGVITRMRRRWYYRLAEWAIRDLAHIHFSLGVREWEIGKYERAAHHWRKATFLDSDRDDAAYWYGRALSMVEQNKP